VDTDPTRSARSHASRPDAAKFAICNGPFLIDQCTRVNFSLDDLLAEEAEEYGFCMREALEAGQSAAAYAAAEEDRSVWRDDRQVALLRARESGALEVLELDPGDDGRGWRVLVEAPAGSGPAPDPEPGDDEVPRQPDQPAVVLTDQELLLLNLIRVGGAREMFDRMTLTGRYAELGAALGWWGSKRQSEPRPDGA
jgi:hypothetical protein